jgi:hypothetical protein
MTHEPKRSRYRTTVQPAIVADVGARVPSGLARSHAVEWHVTRAAWRVGGNAQGVPLPWEDSPRKTEVTSMLRGGAYRVSTGERTSLPPTAPPRRRDPMRSGAHEP